MQLTGGLDSGKDYGFFSVQISSISYLVVLFHEKVPLPAMVLNADKLPNKGDIIRLTGLSD